MLSNQQVSAEKIGRVRKYMQRMERYLQLYDVLAAYLGGSFQVHLHIKMYVFRLHICHEPAETVALVNLSLPILYVADMGDFRMQVWD